MHNNTNNSDRMNTVAYKIGQAIALVACLCVKEKKHACQRSDKSGYSGRS